MIGVELGGAVKNVIGLAVGIAEGMGLGDNAKASIITRGLAEIARLGVALGAEPATFAGLAGMGDLVATCASPLSRNRTFGVHLGQGMPLAEVVKITNRTAEGVTSSGPILELARAHGVDMPITEAVTAVVHDGSLGDMVVQLLSWARKSELTRRGRRSGPHPGRARGARLILDPTESRNSDLRHGPPIRSGAVGVVPGSIPRRRDRRRAPTAGSPS